MYERCMMWMKQEMYVKIERSGAPHSLPNPLGNRRSDIKLKLLYVFKRLIVELENALGKVPHEHWSATETNNENIFIYFISSGMDLEVVFVAG